MGGWIVTSTGRSCITGPTATTTGHKRGMASLDFPWFDHGVVALPLVRAASAGRRRPLVPGTGGVADLARGA